MSRLLLFTYACMFLVFTVGTLAVANAPLAATPLGFSAIFLPMLALFLITDLVIAKITPRHNLLSALLSTAWTSLVFILMGAGGWSILAGVTYAVIFYTRSRSERRAARAPTYTEAIIKPPHPVEAAARSVNL